MAFHYHHRIHQYMWPILLKTIRCSRIIGHLNRPFSTITTTKLRLTINHSNLLCHHHHYHYHHHQNVHRTLFTNCMPLSSQQQQLDTTQQQQQQQQPLANRKVDPFKLVQNDLDNLYTEIKNELKSEMPELEQISTYYFDGQGKAIRPLIVILIARAMNFHMTSNSDLLNSQKRVALIIEMIHTASLIHDDVIDSADTRRGKPSVNVLWGQKKSIFAGDFVISKGSQMLARLNSPVLVSILSEAIIDLVLGEFMQMGSKKDEKERFSHYIQKTFKKTASLIAYTCRAVTYLATTDHGLQEAAFEYGKNLGIAFQLVDDLLDFVSSKDELGKPAANDLKLGLATAPVLFACEKFPELNEMIIRRFSEPGDVEKTYDAVMKSDGLNHTRMLAQQHADEAARQISNLRDTPEKQALLTLCDMVLNRKK
ncbi:decaprenyl diphosphate synthase subunit 1 qless [Dermatophagoides farinae]|uniref:decaprenyl diphosphate synthase subunit 1 qless n=1 Tax=Dermatophagoides farinae TaxID=6954 RepID=UPI003F62FD9F